MWLMDSDGAIHSGAPEDLILRGELEIVFASEGVSFDREQGSFHLAADIKGYIRLEGKGHAAAWTQRALRREGIDVSDKGRSNVRVKVNTVKAGWSVTGNGKTTECASIYEMIMTVREHLE